MTKSKIEITESRYSIGDLVHHKLFDYRGVIVDIDPYFQLTDEGYEMVARSRPPKNEPWYHVLVHNATNSTYVAEQNLTPDQDSDQIIHPERNHYFSRYDQGRYYTNQKIN